jgi:hypothetical protein
VAEVRGEHVAVAAALARHIAQGRDLRWAVLDWFRVSAVHQLAEPKPPMVAVREALVWALERLPVMRLLSMAAQARTEGQIDAFYLYAEERCRQWGRPYFIDPEAMRQYLLAGQDVPDGRAGPSTGRALIQLGAAAGLGGEGVGADVLADALAGSTLMPEVSRETWEEVLTQAELEGRPLVPDGLVVDPLTRVRQASDEDLLRARRVATELAGFGALLVLHGLLLPTSPGSMPWWRAATTSEPARYCSA